APDEVAGRDRAEKISSERDDRADEKRQRARRAGVVLICDNEKKTHARFLFSASCFSILPSGRQLITSSRVRQPLRASATPNQSICKPSGLCASGLIAHFTRFSFASGHQRQSMSSRFGCAFSSITVPVSA